MTKQELAYQEIKKLILNGELKPDVFLSERIISDRLGISRTPVRAALSELCNDKLIINYPGKGMMVAAIRSEDIHDVYQIRDVLDVLALEIVMDTNNRGVIEEMNGCIEKMAQAERDGDLREAIRQDMLFHDSYIKGVSNYRLKDILLSLHDQITRFLNTTVVDPERIKKSVAEHQRIMDAVNAEDKAGMAAAMKKHLQIARDYHVERVTSGKI